MSLHDRVTGNLNMVRTIVIVASGGWGLFWIPLRALYEQGVNPVWATVLFHVLPLILLSPFAIWRWRHLIRGNRKGITLGFFLGLAIAFYATAFQFSGVVRVSLLYYLLPVWATILARFMLNEPITKARLIAIVFGFSGMLAILGIGEGFPWPENIGDWMALAGGFIWAFGSVLTKDDDPSKPFEITFWFFAFTTAASLLLLLLPGIGDTTLPDMETVLAVLPWMIPVSIALTIPVILAVIWGTGHLSPGHIGVLFLTEISVAAIAAAILTDEPFGLREMLGVLLITAACLCEAVEQSFSGRKKNSPELVSETKNS